MVRVIESRKSRGLQTVRFRNKVEGWKNSHFTAVFEDGTVDSRPLFQTEYGRAFGRALFLRPCCYRCPYASMNRPGDFTLGDFWGLRPEELSDQQPWGVSLLLVNTAHGSHLFDRLRLGRMPFSPERAIAGNPRLASPINLPPDGEPYSPPTPWKPSIMFYGNSAPCRLCPSAPLPRFCLRRSRRKSGN